VTSVNSVLQNPEFVFFRLDALMTEKENRQSLSINHREHRGHGENSVYSVPSVEKKSRSINHEEHEEHEDWVGGVGHNPKGASP